jgi:hypothetical protein
VFGYIRPCVGQLKVCEYETYRAVYCSICHALKDNYGALSTLSLNYDFTFAALLGLALQKDFPGYETFTCVAHPLRKRQRLKTEEAVLPYVGGCVVAMVRAKIADNIADAGSIKGTLYRLTLPLTCSAGKKTEKRFPALPKLCADMGQEQAAAEALPDTGIDAAAQPSARALSRMMEALSAEPVEQRILSRFGYLLGRWIYLIDALDDLEDDLKTGSFNPFLRRFSITEPAQLSPQKRLEIQQDGRELLRITGAEMASAYELLELKRFKSILDNIVYLGLQESMERVFTRRNKKETGGELPAAAL